MENYPNPPKKNRLFFKIAALAFLIVLGGFLLGKKFFHQEKKEIILETPAEETKKPEKKETYIISEGDIPAEVFARMGKLDANDMEALLEASRNVYDFAQIKIGQTLEFIFNDMEEKARKIQYYPNTEEVVICERTGDSFQTRREKIAYQVEEVEKSVVIDEFLYKDALDERLSEATILEIADIFSYDVDFTTEIQPGDELKVIYEKRTFRGQEAPDGRVLAASFVNVGQKYFGYYFEKNGEGSHYDEEGHELLRQFLRAPLSYRYISSGFTGARRHPITKKVSAHYQIDYAAPAGTPVVATARGTVASAGWEGGWGNMVRLRHDNGFTTHYGHLSAFGKGARSGASVSQGQIIGYVGSTGWSTGAHLDYGMRLNGAPINPLSLKLPKGQALTGEDMKKFEEIKKLYASRL